MDENERASQLHLERQELEEKRWLEFETKTEHSLGQIAVLIQEIRNTAKELDLSKEEAMEYIRDLVWPLNNYLRIKWRQRVARQFLAT